MKRTQTPISTKKSAARVQPAVRPIPLISAAHGSLWRMSGRHGVAYVRDAALAGELLATDPRNLGKMAMAVYYDRKGKAFAWQVRFDTDRWEEVVRRMET